jgi:hypothetical protein
MEDVEVQLTKQDTLNKSRERSESPFAKDPIDITVPKKRGRKKGKGKEL